MEALFRRLIESLFQKKFGEITSLTAQSELRPAALARWEDLDVKAYVADQPLQKKEDQILIDAEMQNKQLNTILFRARITGSGLDVRHTRKGTSTYNLIHAQRRIIIYVCTGDPFGYHQRVYFISSHIRDLNVEADDGTLTVILNAQGTEGKVPVDIEAFLNYVKSGTDDGSNAFVHAIHQEVIRLNKDEEFVRKSMTFEQKVQLERYDAEQSGRKEGMNEGFQKGISGAVSMLKNLGYSDEVIVDNIGRQYHLTRQQAEQYL